MSGLKKKRAASTESVDSQASFSLPSMLGSHSPMVSAESPQIAHTPLSLKSVPSGKSMSSSAGPYKPLEQSPIDLKQPQTLDEDEEEPPSPLSTANLSMNLNLEDMKNGSLQLLKEDDNGNVSPFSNLFCAEKHYPLHHKLRPS